MPTLKPCLFRAVFLCALYIPVHVFVVLRVPIHCSFSFVLSFRLVIFRLLLVSPPSLLFALPCCPRILLFCYFVSALHPPRAPCEPEVCVFPLRAVFFLALLMLTYLYFFLLFLPFFDFDLDIACFILSFSCGYYAVSSVSVSAATRVAYDMYLDTYVRSSHSFIFVWGIRFVSVIVCIIFCFYLFSSWGDFPLQSYWSLSCDHGLHCSDELMLEQQQCSCDTAEIRII